MMKRKNLDIDSDGIITEEDIIKTEKFFEMKMKERKSQFNRRIALSFTLALFVVIILITTPIITPEKIKVIEGLLTAFIWAAATLIGAVLGVTSWANK